MIMKLGEQYFIAWKFFCLKEIIIEHIRGTIEEGEIKERKKNDKKKNYSKYDITYTNI